MKKFLTVLLALSVVFTYSFSSIGSAFAATTANENVAKALGYVTSIHDSAKQLVSDNGDQKKDNWKVSATNWTLAYEEAYDALVENVVKATGDSPAEVLKNVTGIDFDGKSEREIKIVLEDYLSAKTTGKTYSDDYAAPALKAQLVEEKTDALKKVASVDTSVYSTKEYTKDTAPEANIAGTSYYWNAYSYVSGPFLTAGDPLYVAKSVADSIIKGLEDGINAVTTVDSNKTGTAATTEVTAAYTALNNLMNAHIALNGDKDSDGVEDADETWTYSFVSTITILTTAEEEAGDASDQATVAAKKAAIAANIAAFKASAAYLNADIDQKAAYDEFLNAYHVAHTFLVENVADHIVGPATYDKNLVVVVKEGAEYTEEAAELKSETNKDGSLKYDADQIDKNLKTILIALYTGKTPSLKLTDGALIAYVTDVKKADEKAQIKKLVNADDKKYNSVEYYGLEWKAVEEAVNAYYAAVDVAVVSKDIADAKADLNKAIGKVDPAAKVLSYYATSGKLNATANSEFAKLKAYASSLSADQGTADKLVFDIIDILDASMELDGSEGTLVKYYIDKDARTVAEITALNGDVKALLASAKAESVIKGEAKAVVAMISALPAEKAITVADKAAIEAAYNAYEALNDGYKVYVTNYSTLKKAIAAVAKAEKDEILKATKNLPAKSAVTPADKEAVKAVADMIEVYNNTEMYNNPTYTNVAVNALLAEIRTQELDAIKSAVKDMPATDKITAKDKETVEKARALYDAFLKSYGDELSPAEVITLESQEKKIIEAEKALVIVLEEAKADIIAGVKAVKVVKNHSKAGKGYIKIAWSTVGDTSMIDGYRVYRSTKANSGYKYIFQTKNKSYKNTKNLKKGTRYYYKVRAYVELDGKRYFSDYSNKAYRAAK